MTKDYEEWKQKKLDEDNPDLECLRSLTFIVKQYLSCTHSRAAKGLLDRSMGYFEKWITERGLSL